MKNETKSGGIGLGTLIFLVLLIAKTCFDYNITWFWVFLPLWLPFAIFFGIIGIAFVFAFILAILVAIFDRK